MPRSSCDVCCQPVQLGRSVDTYRGGVLKVLCEILAATEGGGPGATGTRYDYEVLCVPVTFAPVLVRIEYETDGTIVGFTGWNADGSAYGGALAALVACIGSTGGTENVNLVSTAAGGFGPITGHTSSIPVGVRQVVNDTAEAGSTTSTINATGHIAQVGDIIQFAPGVNARNQTTYVATVSTNSFTVQPSLQVTPTTADFFAIQRPGYPLIDDNWALKVGLYGPNGATAIFSEDGAHNSGDNGVPSWGVAATTPATTTTSGRYSPLTTNPMGVQYTEPSNQVATYAAAAVAGAAGGVTTTGASVLTNAAKAKNVIIGNTLDVGVLISLDAGTTYIAFVPATNGTLVLDLGANGRWTASNIFAKAVTSNSSSGTLYVGLVV